VDAVSSHAEAYVSQVSKGFARTLRKSNDVEIGHRRA